MRQLRTIRRSVSQAIFQISCRGFGSDEAWLWKRYAGHHSVVVSTACGCECSRWTGFPTSRYDHITPLLRRLHWLRVPQRISFKLPSWFTTASVDLDRPTWPTPFSWSPGFPVDNACSHRRRRHWTTRLSTVGDRAFSVAAARAWNSLPAEVTSSNSLQTFQTVVSIVSKLL